MDKIVIAFIVGLASFIGGYLLGQRRARGYLKMAEELADRAGEMLDTMSQDLKEFVDEQQKKGR